MIRKALTLYTAVIALFIVGTTATSDFSERNARYINEELVRKIKAHGKWIPFEADQNPLRHRDISAMSGKGQSLSFASGVTSQLSKWHLLSDKPVTSPFTRLRHQLKPTLSTTPLLPAFDARDQWPNCIHSVRDQETCGSCWAFSSTGHLEDRLCIATGGSFTINDRLSPQNMVSCDFGNAGCNGGFITASINYLIKEGVVSEDCMAYRNVAPFCMYHCDFPQTQYKKHHCKLGSTKILMDHGSIQRELMTNGPMVVGFDMYHDLYDYQSGVYEHLEGELEGGHAVKLIGWYYDAGNSLIWICQNQWGTLWGENGYFNIRTGVAGMDLIAWSCEADV
ncbi:hypothetical protein FGO68_gene12384 [Halteria grandinella]|uniref:Peptidase C1A papain C-terminal domain-containing protein n=1 Tax=Halteria grandinella TaxID=5974 RepID=A0A8J8NVU9_HALGN|nr:hypothetical protein FGO68_gene12384 [Halteria grandinella]